MTIEDDKFKNELKKAGFTHVNVSEEIVNIDFHSPIEYKDAFSSFPDTQQKLPAIVSINDGEVFITMKAQDWLSIIKETNRVNSIFCPDCKSPNVVKNGFDIKGKQRYNCLNENCLRVNFIIRANPHI